MAHIYLFSPAGAVADRQGFKRGVERLKHLGHEVEIDPSALRVHQRFAGTDEERLSAFARAAASKADAVLITRGGYGITRIIHQLPYAAIQKSIQRGTQWLGYSDFTAFQCGLWQRKGEGSWGGPSLVGDIGAPEPDEITLACLEDVLAKQSEGTGWRLKANDHPKPQAKEEGGHQVQWARAAPLWGGNLTVLTGLLGTPFFPQIKKGVLYLEDVAEHPYRIERMLTQLHLAGVLDAQQLIVLGQFSQYKLVPFDRGFNMLKVVQALRSQTRTPILTGMPFGHVPTKVCLPFGSKVDVTTQDREAWILWGEIN